MAQKFREKSKRVECIVTARSNKWIYTLTPLYAIVKVEWGHQEIATICSFRQFGKLFRCQHSRVPFSYIFTCCLVIFPEAFPCFGIRCLLKTNFFAKYEAAWLLVDFLLVHRQCVCLKRRNHCTKRMWSSASSWRILLFILFT